MSSNIEMTVIPKFHFDRLILHDLPLEIQDTLLNKYGIASPSESLHYLFLYGVENIGSLDNYFTLASNPSEVKLSNSPLIQAANGLSLHSNLKNSISDKFIEDICFIEFSRDYFQYSNDQIYEYLGECFENHYGMSPYKFGLDTVETSHFTELVSRYESAMKEMFDLFNISDIRPMQDLFTIIDFDGKFFINKKRCNTPHGELIKALVGENEYENLLLPDGSLDHSCL